MLLTPSSKDLAEFARHAIRLELLDFTVARDWGDAIILQEDQPPLWAIDIACAKRDDVEHLLSEVPGAVTDSLAINLLCAFVRKRWCSGKITIGAIRRIGWTLHVSSILPPMSEASVNWGVVLECEGEELDEGWSTEKQFCDSIDEKLEPYSEYEPLLPPWAT